MCALCITRRANNRHHLVPVSMRHVARIKAGKIWTCRKCHVDVHWYFTNQELALEFFDVEKLRWELKLRMLGNELTL